MLRESSGDALAQDRHATDELAARNEYRCVPFGVLAQDAHCKGSKVKLWALAFVVNCILFAFGVWVNGLGWWDVVIAVCVGLTLANLLEEIS